MNLYRRVLVVLLMLSALAGGCSSVDEWQRRTIFQTEAAALYPDAVPPQVQELDLPVPGGGVTGSDRVHAWYLPAANESAPTVLYLHGAKHNLTGNADRVERLNALGFNVLAIDYRGFGRSTRILPSEASALEDARIAFAELQRRAPDARDRYVYGYSLGGAIAIGLIGNDANNAEVAGLIIDSSFTSIADVVRGWRWGWLPFVRCAVTQNFSSIERIAQVQRPVLFLHGTADTIVPHTMSDHLAAAAAVPAEFKRVVKIEGAGHRGGLSMDENEFRRALGELMDLAHRYGARGERAFAAGAAGAPRATAAQLH